MSVLQTILRNATPADAPDVLRLNDGEVQWTSPMDAARLGELARLSSYYRVAVSNDVIAGFLLGMRDGCGYRNENFKWFEARYRKFLYIDRIIVDRRYAGRGVGRLLYADAFAVAKEGGANYAVCEYSWRPRNTPSQKFHARMGFGESGRRNLSDRAEVLTMQYLRLDQYGFEDV